jgi:hypothetical protein
MESTSIHKRPYARRQLPETRAQVLSVAETEAVLVDGSTSKGVTRADLKDAGSCRQVRFDCSDSGHRRQSSTVYSPRSASFPFCLSSSPFCLRLLGAPASAEPTPDLTPLTPPSADAKPAPVSSCLASRWSLLLARCGTGPRLRTSYLHCQLATGVWTSWRCHPPAQHWESGCVLIRSQIKTGQSSAPEASVLRRRGDHSTQPFSALPWPRSSRTV